MPDVCSICGAPLGKESKPSRAGSLPYCPGCRRDRRRMASNIAWLVLYAFVFVMCLGGSLLSGRLVLPAFLVYFAISYYLVLAIHETAHALAGILLGYRILEVRLGGGAAIARLQIGEFTLTLGWSPASGHTICATRHTRALRARSILVSLAGPAANLAVALALGFRLDWFSTIMFLSFLQILALVNAVKGFMNLLPYLATMPTIGRHPTDGLAALLLLRVKKEQFRMAQAAYYSLRALQSRKHRRLDEAERFIEQGLALVPDNPINLNDRAALLLELERPREARAIFADLATRNGVDPTAKPFFQNNLAWADLLCHDPDLLTEADDLSAQAMACISRTPHFYGTRGAVLVVKGRPEQALPLLRQAHRRHVTREDRAVNLYFIARAEAILGRADEATYRLDQARRLDADEVGRLERCLAKEMGATG